MSKSELRARDELHTQTGTIPGAISVDEQGMPELTPDDSASLGQVPDHGNVQEAFRHCYLRNYWGGSESRSGNGSSKDRGAFLAERIPMLLEALGIRSLLDVPCGDMNWMSEFPLHDIEYIGVDIVPELIAENIRRHRTVGSFLCLDACHHALPDADLILCRDMITHLPISLIQAFLRNVARSNATWLLCSRFLGQTGPCGLNEEVNVGGFRSVDLCEPPFVLPTPLVMVPEREHKWKTLGLWKVATIREWANS